MAPRARPSRHRGCRLPQAARHRAACPACPSRRRGLLPAPPVLLLASSRVQEKPRTPPPPFPPSVSPPQRRTAEPRNPSRPWLLSGVASERTSSALLVYSTRRRLLRRFPLPIEDEEHPRRRQPPRDLAGPARRRRQIRRLHRVPDPATTSARTRVSSSSSSPIHGSPFLLCFDSP